MLRSASIAGAIVFSAEAMLTNQFALSHEEAARRNPGAQQKPHIWFEVWIPYAILRLSRMRGDRDVIRRDGGRRRGVRQS